MSSSTTFLLFLRLVNSPSRVERRTLRPLTSCVSFHSTLLSEGYSFVDVVVVVVTSSFRRRRRRSTSSLRRSVVDVDVVPVGVGVLRNFY